MNPTMKMQTTGDNALVPKVDLKAKLTKFAKDPFKMFMTFAGTTVLTAVSANIYVISTGPDIDTTELFKPATPAEAFSRTYGMDRGEVAEMPRHYIEELRDRDQYGPRSWDVPVTRNGNQHKFNVTFSVVDGQPVFSLYEGGECVGATRPTGTKISSKRICANGE